MRLPPFRGSAKQTGRLRVNTDSPQYAGTVFDLIMVGGVPCCLIGGTATIDGTQPPMRSAEHLGGLSADVDNTHVIAVLGHTQRFPMTLCAWIRCPAGSDYFMIFSNTATKTSNHMYRFGLSPGPALSFTTGGISEYVFGLPYLTAGELYFVGVSVVSTGGAIVAYQGSATGNALASVSGTAPSMSDPGGALNAYIGTGNNYGPTISVERVRQYDRVLTAAEMRHIFAPETRNDLYAPV